MLNWDAEALWQQLEPLRPGLSVEVVADTASTNTTLLARARAADATPCLLVAERQSGGRGRLGRAWQAAPGASLSFSLALPLAPADWSGLSLAVGVALAEALDPQPVGATRHRLGLKWPNDLWLLDAPSPPDDRGGPVGRKLGGILIETVATGPKRLAVIGIGLNVLPQQTLRAAEASSGVACLQEMHPGLTAPEALAIVARPLVQALLRFECEGYAPFAAGFAARDLLDGQAVTTTRADAAEGIARGVAADGSLWIDTARSRVALHSGEVSVRPRLAPPAGPAPEPAC